VTSGGGDGVDEGLLLSSRGGGRRGVVGGVHDELFFRPPAHQLRQHALVDAVLVEDIARRIDHLRDDGVVDTAIINQVQLAPSLLVNSHCGALSVCAREEAMVPCGV